jgi:hypothetical protein
MAEMTSAPVRLVQRRLPSALTDAQVQDQIDRAVQVERERCVGIVHEELLRWDARRGVGWSWDKCRDSILTAIGPLLR